MSPKPDTQTRLAAIVCRLAKQEVVPDPEESLFDAGYLDSFALTDFVSEIELEFNVSIPDSDLNPRRFETLARIGEYLDSKSLI